MKPARLAATLVAVAVLAGCSDDSDPKTEPSASPTSASPSADLRAIEKLFVESFVDAVSASLTSGDPSAFLAMTDARCANCRTLADNVRASVEDGGRVVGGSWTLQTANFVRKDSLGSIWNVDVRTGRERWLDSDGEVYNVVPPETRQMALAVETPKGEPQVRDLRLRE